MGADPVAFAIAHRSWLDGHPLDAFSVRKKAKEHGTGQRIEGGLPEGAACLVIEDSMTTGSSALKAVAAIREHGAIVVGVLTLVDREEGGRDAPGGGRPATAFGIHGSGASRSRPPDSGLPVTSGRSG